MDLGHLKGIHMAIKKTQRRYNIKVTEPLSAYFFNKTVEKKEPEVGFDTKKEVHAGFRETSLMKYQYPYLVDKNHKDLQNIHCNLYSPRTLGKKFKDLGINDGYVGSPARADRYRQGPARPSWAYPRPRSPAAGYAPAVHRAPTDSQSAQAE